MSLERDHYAKCPEVVLVGLARNGDRDAFAELVRQRQSWMRNLMRRCCGEASQADDLAQQAFLEAWRTIGGVRRADRFGGWLKRLAINVWLQHLRKRDPLRNAEDADALDADWPGPQAAPGVAIDLDRALATLPGHVRLCIVLSYHEGMTSDEIAEVTGSPTGTVKSHIRRGALHLRGQLSAYADAPAAKDTQ